VSVVIEVLTTIV